MSEGGESKEKKKEEGGGGLDMGLSKVTFVSRRFPSSRPPPVEKRESWVGSGTQGRDRSSVPPRVSQGGRLSTGTEMEVEENCHPHPLHVLDPRELKSRRGDSLLRV